MKRSSAMTIFLACLVASAGCSQSTPVEPAPQYMERSANEDELIREPLGPPIPPVTIKPVPPPAPAPIRKPVAPAKMVSHRRYTAKQVKQTKQQKKLTLAQLVRKYPKWLKLSGPASKKEVALTFDDGPDGTYTPQILNILKRYEVPATFFLVGTSAQEHPEMIKRMVKEGHVIGNHSYNHKLMTKLSDRSFQKQITDTQRILHSVAGYKPKLIRPPYGAINEQQLTWSAKQKYVIVNWNVDSQDWRQIKKTQVLSNVLDHVRPGSIILQHCGGAADQNLDGTVKALPVIIESLQAKGYKLVTLPDLLNVPKQVQ